jgi:glycosyltransferase involved in cell wall biosynthesis
MDDSDNTPQNADVCLVLEGGYPHVVGGVSVWVDQLTRNLPDVRFAVAHVREQADERPPRSPAYAPARNVVGLVELEVERSREHLPQELAARLPQARTYHACITGFASDAAAAAAAAHGRPLLVTEHGLAWRESRWTIGCGPHVRPTILPHERERRYRRARRQARDAYRAAAAVTSVCSANVAAQGRLGAAAERSVVIPNPVARVATNPAGPGAASEPRSPGVAFQVGFVGRVVPIKDVATLLRAAAIAARTVPLELTLVGPLDHDPAYVDRCRELARRLGIARSVRFAGEADPAVWYPRFDAVALTSVSEAQPLALLEAMAAGVPVVATRVGGCPELVAGPVPGRRIGPGGLLVADRDPGATARALLSLAHEPERRRALGDAGRARTAALHAPGTVWAAYRSLYERAAA